MERTKLKKIGVLIVSAIIMTASVLSVYADGKGYGGYIYKNNSIVGEWKNHIDRTYASASTGEMRNETNYYKNTYMTVNVQSIYPNGGSHAYYINATLNAGQSGSHYNSAFAEKNIPTTEYGTSANTKHIIIINGTAYTPVYNNGTSNLVTP